MEYSGRLLRPGIAGAALLAAAASLGGCATTATTHEQAQALVEAALPRQKVITFRNIETYPGNTVCGEWQGKSPDGEFRNYLPFIVRHGAADVQPSRDDVGFYCNDDPATWFAERSGIEPVTADNKELTQVMADLSSLGDALERYYQDYFGLPSTAQGLGALTAPGPNRVSGKTPEPYLDELPADPWGRAYRYENNSLGGVRAELDLQTHGADGQPGGTGSNADISYSDLEYLRHLLTL